MENVQRIGGEKYHLNRLTDDELNNIRMHTIAQVSGLLHDVEIIELEIARRRPEDHIVLDQLERTPLAQQDFERRRIDL